jgi:hypothetical protein
LLADLAACLQDWDRVLRGGELRRDLWLAGLIERTQSVEQRSAQLGFGGLGVHLARLSQGSLQHADLGALRAALDIVKEMEGQVRDAVRARRPAPPAPVPAPSLDQSMLAPAPSVLGPPKFITHVGTREQLLGALGPLPVPAPPPAVSAAVPPLPHVVPAPQPLAPPDTGAPALPPRLDASQIMNRDLAPPAAGAPSPMMPAPLAPPPVVGSPSPVPQPPFSPVPVLRAAPQQGGASPQPASHHPVKSLLNLGKPFARRGSVQPPPAAPAAAPRPASALDLKGLSNASRTPALPKHLGELGELPPLPRDLPLPGREHASHAPRAEPSYFARAERSGGGRRARYDGGESHPWRWFALGTGLMLLIGGIVGGAVVLSRRGGSEPAASGAPSSSGVAAASGSAPVLAAGGSAEPLPKSRLLTEDERFRSLLVQVHGRGKESGALRALLDDQAAVAAQSLAPGACVGPQCAALKELNKFVTSNDRRRLTHRHAEVPEALRSKWLAGNDMPEIHVEDDPRVQTRFEYYTQNSVGHEQFQQMLFKCGRYQDAIKTELVHRGLPEALLAVVITESGCSPLAKSPVGAEGLWQLMPDAARAYGLRIIPNVVDERHSPVKSTVAGVRYLADLYAKFGSWDLVFAAYNMGPFGLATRISRVEGSDVGFWDLADADLLPDETLFYVPNIEAVALILVNLQRQKFTGQVGAPEITAELDVPPNTRMGLIARAAAVSLTTLHRLNLDILGEVTPNVPHFAVEVPKDNLWQARDQLPELLKSHDDADLCVPPSFDWGRQQFTTEMAKRCKPELAAAASAAPAARPVAAP